MSLRRKVATIAAVVVAVLAGITVLVPFLFRDRIEARVRAEIEANVSARVAWGGVGISLFRHFPHLTFRLDDLVVTGVERFEGDTLFLLPRFRLVLDLGSVLRGVRGKGPFVVRAVELRRPDVRLQVLEDGTANWDIVPDAPAEPRDTAAAPSVSVSLQRLAVEDGAVSFHDRQLGLLASLEGLSHTLSGDFALAHSMMRSRTVADAVSVSFAGMPYLSQARLEIDADIEADMEAQRYTLQRNVIRLNNLLLEAAGSVAVAEDSIAVDVAFSSPNTEFSELLSLVPAVFAAEFESLQTAGSMEVAGWVRGGFGATAFPALSVEVAVHDGMLRYPDLPLPARNILLDLAVTNPGGDADSTVVDLRRFQMVLGNEPIRASLVLRTPVSDPELRLRLDGRLDLADVGRTFKLEGVEELAGEITVNADVHARLSDVEAGRFDRVEASGGVDVARLVLQATELPHPLRIEEARLRLSPAFAELASFRGTLGSSDFAATGRLDNLLGFALRDEELRGSAHVTSRYIALDELQTEDEFEIIPVPAMLDFTLDAFVDRLTLGPLEMRNAKGQLHIKEQRATLQDFTLELLGGSMTVTGYYETTDPARPGFDVDLRLAGLDVPSAFAGISTVRAFAPVAEYARGSVSADLRLNGVLGKDLAPIADLLSGRGTLWTSGLRLQGFPGMERLADATGIQQFRNPAFSDTRSSIEIRDGKLYVEPFDVQVGQLAMNVSGYNALDQSLQYNLALHLPRAALGTEANRLITELGTRLGRVAEVQVAEHITLNALLTGTVRNPAVSTDLADVGHAAAEAAARALRQAAERQAEAMAEEARRQAEAEAERIIAEAERLAASIREEARRLAETVRREGYEQADALVARASGAIARAAAQAAADRLRAETDQRADQIIREADARAEAILAEARRRAGRPPDG